MCGIVGIVTFDTSGQLDIERVVKQMTDLQKHRGPDGEGFYVHHPVAFGHRRLSIIDLSTGAQPISNEDQSVWITFNGEIYNYQALRDELLTCGHSFHTHSDTEVIVHGYEEWGTGVVNKLRGMFAFAIADLNKQKVFIARDPFGIKPLVYRTDEGFFAFASEINALKNVNGKLAKGNAEAVDIFLRYGYIPAPETIFLNIRKLLPGCFMEVSFGGEVKITRYWDFDFAPNNTKTSAEWTFELEKTIDESVAAHTISDVPYGVFLSGGIDSTLIASSLKKYLGHSSTAFCMDFVEKEYSELTYAKQAAEKIGHNLITGLIDDIEFDDLKKIIKQYGEPFGDSSCIPTWKIAELVRKHVPLVLSGDGGDELFAGYAAGYLGILSHDPWFRIKRGFWEMRFRRIASGIKQILLGKRADPFKHYISNLANPNPGFRKMVLQKNWHHLTEIPCQAIMDSAERCYEQPDFLLKVQKMDVLNYMPNDILTKVDIATMAHGLETRPPLIDKEVYSIGLKIPSKLNFTYSWGKLSGKKLLKAILSRQGFDDAFVHRSKKGFTVPKKIWFQEGGRANAFIKEMISKKDHPFNSIFDPKGVLSLLTKHEAGENYANLLWYILVFAIWFEQNEQVEFI